VLDHEACPVWRSVPSGIVVGRAVDKEAVSSDVSEFGQRFAKGPEEFVLGSPRPFFGAAF
jgi:hypothetical protein